MSEDQKKQLEIQLWNIANTLRGKMNADEFRDYILGFIFYKYLSERMNMYADSLLESDEITYTEINEETDEGKQYLEAVKEASLDQLGYFLKPSELFSAIAKRGNSDAKDDGDNETKSNFILQDLAKILNNIEQSTMGTESEDDFDNLFEDLDLASTKLGRTENEKNRVISKVLSHLDKIDFHLADSSRDVLGDAYEYLIGQFASGAGKKAGEFYTPQEVSKVLAKIVTTGKTKLKSVYDPTCGSGSLLLRVAREVKDDVGKFYGQELNRTTYNLARMNMILHGVHYQKFDIKQEDSLERPQHFDLRAEAIVANPPFSAQWSASPLHLGDDRFSQYGRLAPGSKADFAFIQHMIHHLADNGIMAVVVSHGVLFRGGAEGHIRQYLIENQNYLDAVISLPGNVFYGTNIPTCVLVFKKCRENPDDILFIDASQHFEKTKNQNYLRDLDIKKIIETYRERIPEKKYSHLATLNEIKENDFNLSIPRYVDRFETEDVIDISSITTKLLEIDEKSRENDKKIDSFCSEINLSKPQGNNISLLKQYKKGVIQQIFSQTLRFKDNNGNQFPDWEEKKLNEFLIERSEQTEEPLPLYSLTIESGITPKSKRYERSFLVKTEDEDAYKVMLKNDFAFNPMNLRFGALARHKGDERILISKYYNIFFCNEKSDSSFMEYYLTSHNLIQFYNKMATGSLEEKKRVHYLDFIKFKLLFPSLLEQQKIAAFISAIDEKINLIIQQVGKTQVEQDYLTV